MIDIKAYDGVSIPSYSMSSKKKRQSPCSFASLKKPSKSKAFEFIRYIVRAGRKLKTKAKTNLQTRTHESHGRTIVAGNRLQENLVKSVSCQFCHADVTLLKNVSASSGLGSSWILDRVLRKQALPFEEFEQKSPY